MALRTTEGKGASKVPNFEEEAMKKASKKANKRSGLAKTHATVNPHVGARQKALRARHEQTKQRAADVEHAIVTAHTLLLADLEYMYTKHDWSNKICRSLADQYAFELFHGTGQKPFDLNSLAALQVEKRFVRICRAIFVNSDTVPGQRQEWYKEMTSEIDAKAKVESAPKPTSHIRAMAQIATASA